MRPRTNARAVAADAVARVLYDSAFSNLALRSSLANSTLERRDRAFATHLTYGTLTWLGLIDGVLNALLPNGIDSLPPIVASHLRVALFQLVKERTDDTPVHAVIHECVELVGSDEPHLRGLANGVLRTFEREQEDILERVLQNVPTEAKLALSPQVASLLRERVGADGMQPIMDAWNGPTPVVVRSRDQQRDALMARLIAADMPATPHPLVPDALIVEGDIRTALERPDEVSVQDAGAQVVAYTLPPDLEGIVLDACAGLGGKTTHLLDQLLDADIVASDVDRRKIQRIPDGGTGRLALVPGDMTTYAGAEALALHAAANNAEDGYAAIVIDAPCSALGTLGRHPEVRWRRSADDIKALSRIQGKLLKTLAPLVEVGGWLVYVVCTFSEEETHTQVTRFLQAHPDFQLVPPDAETADPRVDWASLVDKTGTISLWPHPHQSDGFFIARFRRDA